MVLLVEVANLGTLALLVDHSLGAQCILIAYVTHNAHVGCGYCYYPRCCCHGCVAPYYFLGSVGGSTADFELRI